MGDSPKNTTIFLFRILIPYRVELVPGPLDPGIDYSPQKQDA